jgi:hypothetical protein
MREHEALELSEGDVVRYNGGHIDFIYGSMLEETISFEGEEAKVYNPRFVELAEKKHRAGMTDDGFIHDSEYKVKCTKRVLIEGGRVGLPDPDFTVAVVVEVGDKEKGLNCAYFDKVSELDT